MSFLVYDLIFLGAFLVFFSVFLYTRKHNLKRDGLLFLYRTRWGIKLIDYLGGKYKRTLGVLSYVSIAMGYLLMAGVLYLIYSVVKIYIFSPAIVRAIKVPPIIPLVPYLPQVFKLQFLPPFYFTYWIIILAIVAISHEMAHGIFMKRYNIKIKSTGFAFFPYFLPIFPAAFVEQDEKSMNKSKKFEQMSVLSAGTFANVITAGVFLLILFAFFSLAFASSGVIFDTYATSTVAVSGITMINGLAVNTSNYSQIISLASPDRLNNLTVGNGTYLATKQMLQNQASNTGGIVVYNNAPAIDANISSIITGVNGVKVNSIERLQEELQKYKPGESVTISSVADNGSMTTESLTLGEFPGKPGVAWLGVGFYSRSSNNFIGNIVNKLAFKNPNIYYAPKFDGISIFIYNLLWWIVLISITVALVNMLPVGIFDGGRFFYLTVWGLTGNEKTARRIFAFVTYLFLAVLVLLMIFWLRSLV